jgi:TRAP transporter TAXI family solute receptor
MKRLGSAALALVLMASGTALADPPYKLTLAGASPGGVWSVIAQGVESAISTAYPGSVITYQTSGGGLANIALVDQHKVPLALAVDGELMLAREGRPPFKGKIESSRAVALVAGWLPMFMVVNKSYAEEHGLVSLEDLAKKKPPIRIAVNRRGNLASMISESMLKHAGASFEDIEKAGGKIVYAASAEAASLMADGRIDMIFNMLPVGHSSLRQLEQTVDLVELTVSKETSEKSAEEMGVDLFTIPKGSHKWVPADVTVPSQGTVLIANKDIDDKTAYDLAKGIAENIDKIQAAHPSLKPLTKEFLVSLKVAPYHPGAIKYYKEAGLMK